MTGEEAQKILDELNTVRIEVLNDEAKRVFEAIMKIADERDKIKQEYDRDTHILQNQLDLADAKNFEKDKIIEQQKEQIDYLRRSCDRKENSLIEEQQENAELENELEQKDKQIERYQNMLVTNDMLHVIECENKDKIIDLMVEMINNQDIDEDICRQMGQNKNCNESEEKCKECIKQYFENKAKGE